ncbi:MAG: nitroreductase family deazaflavin-dependent oxidoreductase, partial [Actinobacteria bacterium]|nr:nitroreductase family deazaflavin-dependent oxidoreductase [Actinomycetota bacterium]
NAWKRDGEVVVALTYGSDVDWLANARAAAPSRMVIEGDSILVGAPRELAAEDGMRAVPALFRPLLEALDVTGFVAFPVTV